MVCSLLYPPLQYSCPCSILGTILSWHGSRTHHVMNHNPAAVATPPIAVRAVSATHAKSRKKFPLLAESWRKMREIGPITGIYTLSINDDVMFNCLLLPLSRSFSYRGVGFGVGDCVYVPADTHRFSVKPRHNQKAKKEPAVRYLPPSLTLFLPPFLSSHTISPPSLLSLPPSFPPYIFPSPPLHTHTYRATKTRSSILNCTESPTMSKGVIWMLLNHSKLVTTNDITPKVDVFTFLYKHCTTGRILSIYQRSGCKLTTEPKLYLKLAMFYRPEDTHKGLEAGRQADMGLLYWGYEGRWKRSNCIHHRHHFPSSPPHRGGGGGGCGVWEV